MKRRGSMKVLKAGMVDYQVGDVVRSAIVSDGLFLGEIVGVENDLGLVNVLWGNTSVSQHGLDEVMLVSCGGGLSGNGVSRESSSCGALAFDGLRSRRAMYWGGPDRTYRLTKREQEEGVFLCPNCKVEMSVEKFKRSDKLLVCSECGFKIPKSKTMTHIEVKVPDNVDVHVVQVDDSGEETSGETVEGITASVMSRRGSFVSELVV